jgi:hypothetical protein
MPASAAARPSALVLPLEVDLALAEAFVRLGFGQQRGFQSTDFLTPRLRTVQAAPLIRLVGPYNDFDGERVAAAVQGLRGRISGVLFGRAGSPVLYVELPYWTHQREETLADGPGSKISEADHAALVAELRHLFVTELKATEFSTRGRTLRVWWS